jgi:hypothetical protein
MVVSSKFKKCTVKEFMTNGQFFKIGFPPGDKCVNNKVGMTRK